MTITTEAALVYRDREDGARWNPKKSEIRSLFESVDNAGRFALAYDDADRRTVDARFQEMPVSVSDFESLVVAGVGGMPDDWGPAFNAAFASKFRVYVPEGRYYIKTPLVQRAGGNMLEGDGVEVSVLEIDGDFSNFSAAGILTIPNTASEDHAGLHNIGFEFYQPGDNHISAIAVSAGGSGYTSAPTVTISGGGGSGATARAVLTAGAVSSIVVTRKGSGYGPAVTLTGGSPTTAARLVPVMNTAGVITSVTIASGGAGYGSTPTVVFTGGSGSGAVATATLTGGVVTAITVSNGGTGYVPTVTITGGSGTGATAGAVTRVATVLRANMVQYPYAVSARAVSRAMIGNLRITQGYNGLDLRDNTGGLMAGRWEVGCINEGVTGGSATGGLGALDFWHIDTLHSWPFGMADAGRLAVYQDGSVVAMRVGVIDGFDIKTLSTFTGRVIMEGSLGSGVLGNIGTLQLDGRLARLEKAGGRLAIGSAYGSTDLDADFKIKQTGGHLDIGACFVFGSATGTLPIIENAGGAYMSIATMSVPNGPKDAPVIQNTSGGMKVNARFLYGTNIARTAPFILQVSGPLDASGCTFQPIGTGSGEGIKFTTNDLNNCAGLVPNGWPVVLPATSGAARVGIYGPLGEAATKTWGTGATVDVVSGVDAYLVPAGTAIGSVLGGYDGQSYSLTATGDRVLINGGSFKLRDAVNRVIKSGEVMRFTIRQNIHVEESVPLTAWISASITPTPAVGSFGSASATIRYRVSGGIIEGSITNVITTIGSAAGPVSYTMPFIANGSEAFSAHDFATGNVGGARIGVSTATLSVCANGNTMLGGTGSTVVTSFNYRVQP